ncbi:kinase-like protein [Ceratobasidium sp. AG-I]|nr:kinase-like protein [Ceratobasidium sp. AG-I]
MTPPDLTSSITLLGYIKGGGQADIRKARLETKDGYRMVVVKQFRHTEEAMLVAENETKTWRKANEHSNVVELLGTMIGAGVAPSLVSEFCERGDLLSYTFNAARSNHRNMLSDVLEGLSYIHNLKIAHGDLKPENVVLTTQLQRLTAKICDFGSARDVSSKRHIPLEYTCTTLYRSPELSTEEDITPSPSFASDVWAFGCIAFVVLCKKLPYHWVRNRWIIDSYIASKKPPCSEDDQWIEADLKQMALSCWMDVASRPSAESLVKILKGSEPDTSVVVDVSAYKEFHISQRRLIPTPTPVMSPPDRQETPPASYVLDETKETPPPRQGSLEVKRKLYPYRASYTSLQR